MLEKYFYNNRKKRKQGFKSFLWWKLKNAPESYYITHTLTKNIHELEYWGVNTTKMDLHSQFNPF